MSNKFKEALEAAESAFYERSVINAESNFKAGAEWAKAFIEESKEHNPSQKTLESLTPGGSEYYNDPERCAAFIRDQIHSIPKIILQYKKRIEELEKQLEESKDDVPSKEHNSASVASHTCISPILLSNDNSLSKPQE